MSDEEMDDLALEYYVDGIALTCVSCFGILGTLLSIRVLLKNELRNSFSTLLLGLAIADASFLINAILVIGLPNCWEWYKTKLSFSIIPVAYGLMGVARTSSVYLTMSVTLERYYAIVKPFAIIGWLKRKLFFFCFGFAAIYNIPKFFELQRGVFIFTNETTLEATPLRLNETYVTIYNTWMKLIFIEAIPYLTIVTLNISIVRKIFKSSDFRATFKRQPEKNVNEIAELGVIHRTILRIGGSLKRKTKKNKNESKAEGNNQHGAEQLEMAVLNPDLPDVLQNAPTGVDSQHQPLAVSNSNQSQTSGTASNAAAAAHNKQETSLALTLVFISLLFIVCQSVKIIPDIYDYVCQKVDTKHCSSTPVLDTIVSISNLVTCLNSSANFLVYMLRGKKFRDAFCNTYKCNKISKCCCCSQQSANVV